MKNNNTNESKLLIDQLAANTVELLNLHWRQAETLAIGSDELRIGIIHSIKPAPEGGFATESIINFGRRIKASVKHTVNPDQIEMPFPEEKPVKAAARLSPIKKA
jgi:hypothetical protein